MHPARSLADEYSAKAGAYADRWAPVIGPMARELLTRLPLQGARRILDLGAGTGWLLPIVARFAPEACIFAADRSEGMLRVAQRSTPHPLAVMDALQLGLRAEAVDAAVLAFMLFHLTDPLAGLREVRRVLRPGGLVGLTTWRADHATPGLAIWTEELNAHGAAADPRDPSVEQHARMDTPEKLAGLLQAAEYAAPHVWSQRFSHPWKLEELLAYQVGCGMPARRLASLSQEARASCRLRVKARLARLSEADLVYRPEVLFATACRPA